jgi:hypothetical protein
MASFLRLQSASADEAVERATMTVGAHSKGAVIMFRKTFGALTLAAAIGGSVLFPTPALAKSSVVVRFYDNDHHDYHRWNRAEDRRYRAYLAERHQRYLAFQRASRQRQIAYWRWRHDHYYER